MLALVTSRIALAAVVVGGVVVVVAVFAQSAPVAVGHRGIPARYPENTLAGFTFALAHGAPVELDVRLSRDGVPVVIHDAVVPARCAGDGERRVRALTFVELRAFDCGGADPAFPEQITVPGARIPSLVEVLALASTTSSPADGPRFLVELKADDDAAYDDVAAAVAAAIPTESCARVVVESFDAALVDAVRRARPELSRGLLVGDARDVDATVALARSLDARLLSPSAHTTSPALVAAAHAANLAVAPWTVNDDDEWRRLARLHVDAIVTDDPVRRRE